jgi:hypothetical protein
MSLLPRLTPRRLRRDRERAPRAPDHRDLDQLAVDHDQAVLRCLECGDHLVGIGDARGIRGERGIDRRELPGVDRDLAGEAQIPHQPALFDQPGLVLEIEPGHVDRVQAAAGRGVDHAASGIEHRGEVHRRAELRRHVDRAEQERADRSADAGDRMRLLEARVALDDHVQPDRARRPLQERSHDPHLVRGLDLRQHDRIRRGRMLDEREQVLEAERRAQAVDPHHPLDAVRGAVEQRHGLFARRVLVRRDDRVLQIDRDHVRAGGERLGESVRAGARHEQQVAARLDRVVAHWWIVSGDGFASGLRRLAAFPAICLKAGRSVQRRRRRGTLRQRLFRRRLGCDYAREPPGDAPASGP